MTPSKRKRNKKTYGGVPIVNWTDDQVALLRQAVESHGHRAFARELLKVAEETGTEVGTTLLTTIVNQASRYIKDARSLEPARDLYLLTAETVLLEYGYLTGTASDVSRVAGAKTPAPGNGSHVEPVVATKPAPPYREVMAWEELKAKVAKLESTVEDKREENLRLEGKNRAMVLQIRELEDKLEDANARLGQTAEVDQQAFDLLAEIVKQDSASAETLLKAARLVMSRM